MKNKNEIFIEKFGMLSESELTNVYGGGWPGEGIVRAAFDIGRETGRAIRSWFT